MEVWTIFAAQLAARQTALLAGNQALPKEGNAPLDYFAEIERDVLSGYGIAARLAASFVALALLFAMLGGATPAEIAVAGDQPSLTPFSAAMWSESIGR